MPESPLMVFLFHRGYVMLGFVWNMNMFCSEDPFWFQSYWSRGILHRTVTYDRLLVSGWIVAGATLGSGNAHSFRNTCLGLIFWWLCQGLSFVYISVYQSSDRLLTWMRIYWFYIRYKIIPFMIVASIKGAITQRHLKQDHMSYIKH